MSEINPQGWANPGRGAIIAPSPLLVSGTFLFGVVFDQVKRVRVLPHLNRVVTREEAFFGAHFGDQFTNYRTTVPRWFQIPSDGNY